MTDSTDSIVIGAGIIGTGIALALARRGRRVVVVDRNPAAGYGSTSNSSAIIRTFYSTYAGCALAWEGMHYWRHWRGFLDATSEEDLARFIPCPAVVLRTGEDDGMSAILDHQSALGIPWEELDAAALAERYPALDLTGYAPPRRPDDPDFGAPSGRDITGAIVFPESGYVTDPQLAARNMQHAAQRFGARFRFNTRVTGVLVENGQAAGVALDGGEVLNAAVVVNAAGPYSTQVNAMAGVLDGMALSTRPLRQEVCRLEIPEGLPDPVMMADADAGGYYRSEVGGGLLVGGMEPACDPFHWVDDPDALDRNPTDQWTAQSYRAALRLPGLGIPNQASGVVDLYDVSDDWNPIYDVSDLPRFFMAVGTSGNQFKNGPVVGDLMAGLIEICETGHDHDAIPCRFALAHTGGEIDLSAFSRRRAPLLTGGNVLG